MGSVVELALEVKRAVVYDFVCLVCEDGGNGVSSRYMVDDPWSSRQAGTLL